MKKPPATTSLSLNLAPMVDVIMCLLIFFMLATRMVEQEDSHIDLPMAQAAKDIEKQTLGSRLVINIRHDNNEKPSYLIREEVMPLSQVLARIRVEGERDRHINCVVRADRTVPYEAVEAILVGCARANISNITFSAIRGEKGGD